MPSREGKKRGQRGDWVTGSCNKKQWQLFASYASLLCCRAFLSSCGFTIWPGESFLRFVAQLTRGKVEGERGCRGKGLKC